MLKQIASVSSKNAFGKLECGESLIAKAVYTIKKTINKSNLLHFLLTLERQKSSDVAQSGGASVICYVNRKVIGSSPIVRLGKWRSGRRNDIFYT